MAPRSTGRAVAVNISEELRASLDAQAAREGWSRAELLRNLIEDFIESSGPAPRKP